MTSLISALPENYRPVNHPRYNGKSMRCPSRKDFSGLYVILDPSVSPGRSLHQVLTEAAAGGAVLFQYRHKTASMKEAYAEALALRNLARDLGVTFIINDRCDLALAVEAEGVHLGQDDLPYAYAKEVMGPGKVIGLSTHNMEQVQVADQIQPDYIGFGPIFRPSSKHDHDPVVGIQGLEQARVRTSLPIFAIGGIQGEQIEAIMKAGANGVAVISAVLRAPDVTRSVQDLISRMGRSTTPTA